MVVIESFLATLKQVLLYRRKYMSWKEAKLHISSTAKLGRTKMDIFFNRIFELRTIQKK
jgi:hypothetical protein